ncbi:hypothetical protein BD311DRAFT_757887, partial [Dichomitus squalens]
MYSRLLVCVTATSLLSFRHRVSLTNRLQTTRSAHTRRAKRQASSREIPCGHFWATETDLGNSSGTLYPSLKFGSPYWHVAWPTHL